MKTKKNKGVSPISFIILAVAVLAIGGVWYYAKSYEKEEARKLAEQEERDYEEHRRLAKQYETTSRQIKELEDKEKYFQKRVDREYEHYLETCKLRGYNYPRSRSSFESVVRSGKKSCPTCYEKIHRYARKCKHCHSNIREPGP